MLCSCGGKQQQFSFGAHRFARRIVLQELADGFTQWRAARFSGLHDGSPRSLQARRQRFELRRFAATFSTLEADE
jgi:hypothetical protein